MYTEIKPYQIIIQLLKERGIRHCVLSAGSRNVPFVHSIEEDSFFKCYSITDERSVWLFRLRSFANVFMNRLLFLVPLLRRRVTIGRLWQRLTISMYR